MRKQQSSRECALSEIRPLIEKAIGNILAEREIAKQEWVAKFTNWYEGEKAKWWRIGPLALPVFESEEEVVEFLYTSEGYSMCRAYGFYTYLHWTSRWDSYDQSYPLTTLRELLTLADITKDQPFLVLTTRDASLIAKYSAWNGKVRGFGENLV